MCVRSASGQPSTRSSATLLNEEHEHWVGSGRRFPRNYNSEDPGGTGKGEWCPSLALPSVAISRGSSGHSADMVGGNPFNHISEKGVPRPGRRNRTDTMPRTPLEISLQYKSPVLRHGQFHPVEWYTGTQSTLAYQPDLRWELAAPFRAANSHERGRGMPV